MIEQREPEEIFTPEDFTEQHRLIARTAEEFYRSEVAPVWERIEQQEPGLTPQLLRKAGELGLLAADLPERYGGSALDKVSSTLIGEQIAHYASFGASFSAHTVIGTLPIAYFGTEAQKQKYLPRLAAGELIAAYCLSEAAAGSDAMAGRTRATLSPDGRHYLLNGEKMWITNAGFAGLYVVFAKVDGEKFSCFLVEREFPGVSTGAEEKKMGLKGSSTRALILENVPVPVENLLGEVGRGHVIAFNILNIGRFKLAAKALGAAKEAFENALRYAQQRHAFGKPIAAFGLIQEKLAEMAARIYAGESMVYRTAGLLDAALRDVDPESSMAATRNWQAGEEYAIECSINKVYLTEALAYVVDEGVQIYGGYGYHQDYPAERAYRDARISRIYEGTNEINRLVIASQLLRRAVKGRLALLPAVEVVMQESATAAAAPSLQSHSPLAAERTLLNQLKKAALFVAGVAQQRFGDSLPEQQEIAAAISDIVSEAFVMESAVLRAEKMVLAVGEERAAHAIRMAQLLVHSRLAGVLVRARTALAASGPGSRHQELWNALSTPLLHDWTDLVALRRQIASVVISEGKYTASPLFSIQSLPEK
ncbi:MAG TPA: acyl-CoA dehydrogenase family protein [Terriglobia bacterium]|nr:acyl-CoA dehydrogenase family protein [Terriglobia bacterium]